MRSVHQYKFIPIDSSSVQRLIPTVCPLPLRGCGVVSCRETPGMNASKGNLGTEVSKVDRVNLQVPSIASKCFSTAGSCQKLEYKQIELKPQQVSLTCTKPITSSKRNSRDRNLFPEIYSQGAMSPLKKSSRYGAKEPLCSSPKDETNAQTLGHLL